MNTVVNTIKGLFLVFLIGVQIASCKKDGIRQDFFNSGSDTAVDYHQTAVTQFIAAGDTAPGKQ